MVKFKNFLHYNNILRYALNPKFTAMFGKGLDAGYFDNVLGFDLIQFQDDFFPENRTTDGVRLRDFVERKHGVSGVELLLKLITSIPLGEDELAEASKWLNKEYVNTYGRP